MQHAAARVAHLHLPTLKTASSVLPWTFLFPHLVLPVWQETGPDAAAHLQPRVHSWKRTLVLTVNYPPLLYDVLLWPAVALILGPHFIPLLPCRGSGASRAQWRGRTLELQKLLGLTFLPLFAGPRPLTLHSSLFSVHRQEGSVLR